MREASYYAEQFFPEHGIRYIAINDNFDSTNDNIMAPFHFAMNEVYLRDGSKKVKEVLNAAALTYVAALVMSLLNLLRFLIIIRDRD